MKPATHYVTYMIVTIAPQRISPGGSEYSNRPFERCRIPEFTDTLSDVSQARHERMRDTDRGCHTYVASPPIVAEQCRSLRLKITAPSLRRMLPCIVWLSPL